MIEEKQKNWLELEEEQLLKERAVMPTPKFSEGQITEVLINASQPFDSWTDPETGKRKAIISCVSGGVECRWWLNKQNPVYKDVVRVCREAVDKGSVFVRIIQTGNGKNTKYTLVK
jgi:hypothetical protein